MATRSLNKVMLIGNLTRDPELRYTPQGTAVCTFGIATNRYWTTDAGEKREETEFHRVVVWNKLAELCAQLLFKGRRVYVEGRLQTRAWTAQDGTQRQSTEIVASDMLILDSRRAVEEGEKGTGEEVLPPEGAGTGEEPLAQGKAASEVPTVQEEEPKKARAKSKGEEKGKDKQKSDDKPEEAPSNEDIPF